MSNRRPRIPAYCRHKSGQARGIVAGKTIYLGKYYSDESRERYKRLIAQWLDGLGAPAQQPQDEPTVNELILTYWRHVEQHYCKPDGRPTSEPGPDPARPQVPPRVVRHHARRPFRPARSESRPPGDDPAHLARRPATQERVVPRVHQQANRQDQTGVQLGHRKRAGSAVRLPRPAEAPAAAALAKTLRSAPHPILWSRLP
jgi:hypothetical protein